MKINEFYCKCARLDIVPVEDWSEVPECLVPKVSNVNLGKSKIRVVGVSIDDAKRWIDLTGRVPEEVAEFIRYVAGIDIHKKVFVTH